MEAAPQNFPTDEQLRSDDLLSEGDIPRRKPAQIGRHGGNCRVPVEVKTTDPKTGEVQITNTAKRCRQKDCPHCGPWLRRCFAAHYTEHFERKIASSDSDQKVWFLTLTTRQELTGGLGSKLEALAERRKKYLEKLRYRSDHLSYLWVAETGERRRPHLHLLVHGDLGQEDLKNSWMKAGGGMINRAKRVEDHDHLISAVWYISKEQFCDPERGEEGFPGHRTNGHSRDIEGYTSEEAKERRIRHAREDLVEKLVEGDVDGRPVCDEETLRMYQKRTLPEAVGGEVISPSGNRTSLLEWSGEGALIETPEGAEEVGSYEVLPVDAPLPRLYEDAEYERSSAGEPIPNPDVEPAPIPDKEATFQLGDESIGATQQTGEEGPTWAIVEYLRRESHVVCPLGQSSSQSEEDIPQEPSQISVFLMRCFIWAIHILPAS
ncbi:hypothetical protein GGP53_001015 [Salinibacter ruber]|uniref:rolling circle replication-associated protein n=1 Tax=Salinibacter ruber TaxID=146919 RepID=UPI00216A6CA2|nr:hypothetical protein [Salinibacter ruber]MCS3627174.1 hypothetical protein [Salinibacter ruber]MCS4144081.1 hypothetical protein [Salinibacter ruber]